MTIRASGALPPIGRLDLLHGLGDTLQKHLPVALELGVADAVNLFQRFPEVAFQRCQAIIQVGELPFSIRLAPQLVNLAGEADTMAAVAGGVAGAFYGAEAIPARWLEKLHQRQRIEEAPRGLARLRHDKVEGGKRDRYKCR